MATNAFAPVPKGRLRFTFAGYLLKLLSLLPARMRRSMFRNPQDAPVGKFADFLRIVQVCDPTLHFGWAATPSAVKDEFPRLASVDVTDIPRGSSGAKVPMRLYRDPSIEPHCALVWVHGGGFLCGGLDCAEANWVGLELAASGVPVLTMEYRKAKDGVTYPAPSDDVLEAWKWAVSHAAQLGVSAGQIHMGGGSAGGNLSAGVTKRLRDLGMQMPASLVLVYPLLHSTLPRLAPDEEALCRQNVKAFADEDFVRGMCLNYVGDPSLLSDPYATPASGSLQGLPPVYIINAQFDSLRGSGEAFAAQLAAEGGTVVCESEKGAPHGYLQMPGTSFAHSTVAKMIAWFIKSKSSQATSE